MLTCIPVNRENLGAVLALQVAENQRSFVAPNVVSMAQAAVMPEYVPLTAFDGETPVGFMMYTMNDADDGECWLCRLMVAGEHQGKGYGWAMMKELLRRVKAASPRRRVFLAVVPGNAAATAMYERFGFCFDGRVEDGEHVMVLEW